MPRMCTRAASPGMNAMERVGLQLPVTMVCGWLSMQLRLLRQRVLVTHYVFGLMVLFEGWVLSSGVKTLGPTFDGCTRQWWCFHAPC